MALNEVERVEVDRRALAELLDLAWRASEELCFADMALADGLKWAVRQVHADLHAAV